jgi:magnesium chelatase family protein
VRVCRCTPPQVERYRGRLSGPLRDRLDLTVEVPALSTDALGGATRGESSAAVRARVDMARERQRQRYESDGVRTNSELTPVLLARDCQLDAAGARLMTIAARRLGLSARGYDRARKVARTIADLAGEDQITADHVAEGLQFRL